MFYDFSLTIPPNTLKSAATEQKVKLTYGIIHRVEIEFPSGCAGLVHTQVYENSHQIYPTNPDGNISSDGRAIAFSDRYELFRMPYQVRLVGWNEDDSYPHTITFRFGIIPPESFIEYQRELTLVDKVKKAFGLPPQPYPPPVIPPR